MKFQHESDSNTPDIAVPVSYVFKHLLHGLYIPGQDLKVADKCFVGKVTSHFLESALRLFVVKLAL
jgi:hypothetical protein